MVTQKEFSRVADIAFEDSRVSVALPIIKRAMYRIQDQNPIAEVGVACLLKIALPRLARAHVLVPEVIAYVLFFNFCMNYLTVVFYCSAAISLAMWAGWLGERVNEDNILCWRCVEVIDTDIVE